MFIFLIMLRLHFLLYICIQGVEKGCIGNEWVNLINYNLLSQVSSFGNLQVVHRRHIDYADIVYDEAYRRSFNQESF